MLIDKIVDSGVNSQLKNQKLLYAARGIICSYFYKSQRNRPLTVDTGQYIAMLPNNLAPALQCFSGFPLKNLVPTSYTSNDSILAVHEILSQKLITKGVGINWQPVAQICCHWTFLLGDILRVKFTSVTESLLMKGIHLSNHLWLVGNFRPRLQECKYKKGLHLYAVIFKMSNSNFKGKRIIGPLVVIK